MKKINLTISKRGLPCIWESGGGATNTGDAVIVADPLGQPLAPIYIRRSGALSNSVHALIPVVEGCLVVEASHHRGDFVIKISRLTGLRVSDPDGDGEYWPSYPVAEFSNGEWDDPDIAHAYGSAIGAAKSKATCYHCREPHYIDEGFPRLSHRYSREEFRAVCPDHRGQWDIDNANRSYDCDKQFTEVCPFCYNGECPRQSTVNATA